MNLSTSLRRSSTTLLRRGDILTVVLTVMRRGRLTVNKNVGCNPPTEIGRVVLSDGGHSPCLPIYLSFTIVVSAPREILDCVLPRTVSSNGN